MTSTTTCLRVAVGLTWTTLLCGCPESPPPASSRTISVAGPLITLAEQGWSNSDAEWFYNISQGSRLVPYDWMKFLKTPDGKFFIASIPSFGFIPRSSSNLNPLGLPVGFVKDEDVERSWVGLTCAACHTSLIEYGGKSYVIDGGPGMGDLEGFLTSLAESLTKTHEDDAQFAEFADGVLGHGATPADRNNLRDAVARIAKKRSDYNDRNLPKTAEGRFGFGRVDAFGAILNEVTVRFLGVDANRREADAPVSYPFLWDTPHHDFVQWNGAAPNGKLKDLARNVGEVLGVFGDLEIPDEPPDVGYASTVQIQNLRSIEKKLRDLKSPLWPNDFPEIPTESKRRGRDLFVMHCADCHSLDFNRDDPNRNIVANMQDVGTDPLMSLNFRKREAVTGIKLENMQRLNFNPIGPRFGAKAPGDALLIHSVVGTIVGGWKDAPEDELRDLKLRKPLLKAGDLEDKYKGRPLNGIWATAPYLHNGSVPTLRDLLKPASQRPTVFWVGSRQFNPTDVGFDSSEAPDRSRFDASVPGNSNAGHEYGAELDADEGQVEDILAFLRSL